MSAKAVELAALAALAEAVERAARAQSAVATAGWAEAAPAARLAPAGWAEAAPAAQLPPVVRQNPIAITVRAVGGRDDPTLPSPTLAEPLPSPSDFEHHHVMAAILICLLGTLRSAVRARSDLVIENLALRQQLAVLKRQGPCRRLAYADRLFWIALSRFWSRWREVLVVVKPATVVGWHRWVFRRFWTWRSRHRQPGRPPVSREVRDLIKRMAAANLGSGAPRIHGELLKLGIAISEREVSRLMPPRRRNPPSQTWRTFLHNHVGSLVSIDFFTVPTATFRILYVFFVLAHDRRRVLHFNVTEFPSADWTAQQIVEAFPEDSAPKYTIRDRDGIYGGDFRRRIHGLGIEEVLTAPRSPWQNPYAESLVGSVRRECLDRVIVLGERHLRRILESYFAYYHGSRTHLSLGKDAPDSRGVHPPSMGNIVEIPEVGGLHHRYSRLAA